MPCTCEATSLPSCRGVDSTTYPTWRRRDSGSLPSGLLSACSVPAALAKSAASIATILGSHHRAREAEGTLGGSSRLESPASLPLPHPLLSFLYSQPPRVAARRPAETFRRRRCSASEDLVEAMICDSLEASST